MQGMARTTTNKKSHTIFIVVSIQKAYKIKLNETGKYNKQYIGEEMCKKMKLYGSKSEVNINWDLNEWWILKINTCLNNLID